MYGEVPGRFSHFFERACLDLPDPLTRYVELCRQVFERQWFVDQMPGLEDTTFAVVQDIDRGGQCPVLVVPLVLLDHDGFRRGGLINEMVLPFTGFAVLVKRHIDRFIAAKASIHIDDILVRDIEALCDRGDMIGMQVTALECRDLAFCRTQFEEELLLVRGSADFHEGPRTQDVILDGSPDPPDCVGGKAKALFRFKAIDCLHQADVAFGDVFRNGKTVTAIAHGDFGGETQMTCDKLIRGISVAVLAPTFGEAVLLVSFQHLEAPDIAEITLAASISDKPWCVPG